jgi:hypothetical protein
MNAINTTKVSSKRKYNELDNTDMTSDKSIKDFNGKRHTVGFIKPELTKLVKNENNLKNISVRSINPLNISRNLSVSREYSLSVKIRNAHNMKRYNINYTDLRVYFLLKIISNMRKPLLNSEQEHVHHSAIHM